MEDRRGCGSEKVGSPGLAILSAAHEPSVEAEDRDAHQKRRDRIRSGKTAEEAEKRRDREQPREHDAGSEIEIPRRDERHRDEQDEPDRMIVAAEIADQ